MGAFTMSQRVSKPTILSVQRELFPRTAAAFDWGKYVIQRTKELVWDAKELIIALLILLLLIQHSVQVILSG
jgi:hypothetical protein